MQEKLDIINKISIININSIQISNEMQDLSYEYMEKNLKK